MIVIDWTGWKPPPFDPKLHRACSRCGFRVKWWGRQCVCPEGSDGLGHRGEGN